MYRYAIHSRWSFPVFLIILSQHSIIHTSGDGTYGVSIIIIITIYLSTVRCGAVVGTGTGTGTGTGSRQFFYYFS